MYNGGCCASITRICDGDVSVRDDVAVQEQRVQRRASDVPRRHVERVEEVPGVLHLVAVDDAVAEPEEDVPDLAPNLRDQVVVAAARRRVTGKRDVDDLLSQRAVELGPAQLVLALRGEQLELFPERARGLARSRRRGPVSKPASSSLLRPR